MYISHSFSVSTFSLFHDHILRESCSVFINLRRRPLPLHRRRRRLHYFHLRHGCHQYLVSTKSIIRTTHFTINHSLNLLPPQPLITLNTPIRLSRHSTYPLSPSVTSTYPSSFHFQYPPTSIQYKPTNIHPIQTHQHPSNTNPPTSIQ